MSLNFAGFSADTATDVLTTLSGSPYGGFGITGIRAYATDTQGRLFTAASSDGGIRVFTTSGGVPTQAGSALSTGFATLTDGVLSPDEQYYVIADSGTSQVASYKINGSGAGTTLASAGIAPSNGSTANTIVFNQAGTYLFAANSSSRNVARFSFNPSTGAMTHLGTIAADSVGGIGFFLAGMDYIPAVAPTAATVVVAGRVISAGGQGISKATVTLIDARGNVRKAVTSPFGYYKFDNVMVGETYTFNASSKGYSFAPQVINVTEELSEMNFSALQSK